MSKESELPSADLVRQLVSQNVRQLELKKQELEIQERDSERGYQYALKALEAQATHLREERQHVGRNALYRYGFVLALVFVGVGGLGWLTYLGKDKLVEEIIKVGSSFLAGGMSSYWLGKSRGRKEVEQEEAPGDDG